MWEYASLAVWQSGSLAFFSSLSRGGRLLLFYIERRETLASGSAAFFFGRKSSVVLVQVAVVLVAIVLVVAGLWVVVVRWCHAFWYSLLYREDRGAIRRPTPSL